MIRANLTAATKANIMTEDQIRATIDDLIVESHSPAKFLGYVVEVLEVSKDAYRDRVDLLTTYAGAIAEINMAIKRLEKLPTH
jgi:hypothetical protein